MKADEQRLQHDVCFANQEQSFATSRCKDRLGRIQPKGPPLWAAFMFVQCTRRLSTLSHHTGTPESASERLAEPDRSDEPPCQYKLWRELACRTNSPRFLGVGQVLTRIPTEPADAYDPLRRCRSICAGWLSRRGIRHPVTRWLCSGAFARLRPRSSITGTRDAGDQVSQVE